jgi:sugar (pentulose or hexulose) kinase
MNCLIGIDIGTSAMKCILISEEGKILGYDKEKNSLIYPLPERVEFNADERYDQICRLIKSVLRYQPKNAKVLAISFSGASGNTLLLNHDKKPIGNAISWQDERAESDYPELLKPFTDEHIHSVCGWPKIGSFPLACFSWIKKNQPEKYNLTKYFATDFIYFHYRLSGAWAIDTSTATNFYLQDQVKLNYYQPFLDFLDLKKEDLPEIVKSGKQIGSITPNASKETNLPEGTPVIAGAFDHPSAARGAGMTKPGDLLLSCGTSWVGFLPVECRDKILTEKMLIDPFLSPEGPWGAMFSFKSIGDDLNRYIKLLFNESHDCYKKFDKAVMAYNGEAKIPLFNLFQEAFSPANYISFLQKDYGIPEISISIMESMAKMMYEKIENLRNAGMDINNVTMVGGFSESKIWPRIIARIFRMPVKLIRGEFAGCLGSAILAGTGVGLFKSESEGFKKINIKSEKVYPL